MKYEQSNLRDWADREHKKGLDRISGVYDKKDIEIKDMVDLDLSEANEDDYE